MISSQPQEGQKEGGLWETLREEISQEMEQTKREVTEIGLMLDQSQVEVSKLQSRHSHVSSQLQQVHQQFDALPRADIRAAYDAALDAQQRLSVMRGQLEKLQSDKNHLDKYLSLMERVYQAMETGFPLKSRQKAATPTGQLVEMMIQAQESERQRLARQMHDEPAQALSNFILQTEIAMRLFDVDQSKAREELGNLKIAAMSTFQKVRDFIFDLRPMMLDDLGLVPTLNRYIEAYKEQSSIEVRVIVSGMEQRLEPYLEVLIFRAVQELVGNSARHSQATQIKIQIEALDNDVPVMVEDNGKGFEVDQAIEQGMGLKLIRDRVEMLNGEMHVVSEAGKGANVTFQIPATKTKVFA
jgi:two-component system sensor histidine kinase DegS